MGTRMMTGRSMRGRAVTTLAVLFFAGLAILLPIASLYKGLDHDEHQFVAGAYLLTKHGLLPYRDFPWFHMPHLLLPYALLFRLTGHLLAAARLFSATCGLLTVVLIAVHAARLFRSEDHALSIRIAVGSATLLAGSTLFVYTSGLAWNHDLSVLLTVAAIVVMLGASGSPRRPLRMACCGALLGLAIGVRLSVVPLVVPFLAAIRFLPRGDDAPRSTLPTTAAFGAGLLLALLPALILLGLAPAPFMFGNFGYAALNTAYREAIGWRQAMSIPGKVVYLLEQSVRPGNLLIVILFGAIVRKVGWRNMVSGAAVDVGFLAAVILFATVGAFAPTPSFRQYFYILLPLSLVAALHGLAWLRNRCPTRGLMRLFAIVALLAVVHGATLYWGVFRDRSGAGAVTAQTHRLGLAMAERAPRGKVLTLAPTYPLEGGLDIYAPFVAGAFGWRTAFLLSPRDRARFGVVAPVDLSRLLAAEPPAIMLVGMETDVDMEAPLITWARGAGYREVTLGPDRVALWLSSFPSPGR